MFVVAAETEGRWRKVLWSYMLGQGKVTRGQRPSFYN